MNIEQRFKDLDNLKNLSDEEVNIELDKLSEEFTPIDNNWTLSLNSEYTLEEVKRNALGVISRLRIFIESNKDPEIAKRLGYSNIRKY